MEAIILAGGFGTRLRPLTYTRAKPLLPILNKPMISYIADNLPAEVDKVILAVNYRKNQIEEYFKEHDFGRELVVNDEPKPLGTGGAVKFAEEHLTGPFLVLNSDIICSLKLSEMIKFHKKKNSAATISLWPVDNVSEFGVADVKKDGNIVGFVEKPKPEDAPSNLINAGAYFLEKEVLDYIPKGKLVSMEQEIFPKIIKDTERFYGYKFQGYWMDIGRISSYLKVHNFLLDKKDLKNYIGQKNEIKGQIKKCTMGNNIKIGENTKIKSSVIYNNAEIESNIKITNCVIGEKTKIGKNSTLKNSVIGDYEKVDANTEIENKAIWNQEIPEGYPKKQIGNIIKT
ncbi:MAG: NDP-sugar synthase [Candidatus Thermoplasmatota archaeon]